MQGQDKPESVLGSAKSPEREASIITHAVGLLRSVRTLSHSKRAMALLAGHAHQAAHAPARL